MRRYDLRASVQREHSQALKVAGWVTQEIRHNSVVRTGVLVQDIDQDGATGQEFEDGVQRAQLGQGAEGICALKAGRFLRARQKDRLTNRAAARALATRDATPVATTSLIAPAPHDHRRTKR